MIDASDIRDRLRQLGQLKAVGLAADFMSALDQLKVAPAAFVLPSKRTPGENTAGTGIISQRVRMQYTILTAFMQIGPAGGAQLDAIQQVEDAIIDLMVGWLPDGFSWPFIYRGGQMVGINADQGVIFWGSDFAADYLLRKV